MPPSQPGTRHPWSRCSTMRRTRSGTVRCERPTSTGAPWDQPTMRASASQVIRRRRLSGNVVPMVVEARHARSPAGGVRGAPAPEPAPDPTPRRHCRDRRAHHTHQGISPRRQPRRPTRELAASRWPDASPGRTAGAVARQSHGVVAARSRRPWPAAAALSRAALRPASTRRSRRPARRPRPPCPHRRELDLRPPLTTVIGAEADGPLHPTIRGLRHRLGRGRLRRVVALRASVSKSYSLVERTSWATVADSAIGRERDLSGHHLSDPDHDSPRDRPGVTRGRHRCGAGSSGGRRPRRAPRRCCLPP